jgi:hypothetical protein
MKKIISILLTGIMILGLGGCSSQGGDSNNEANKNVPTSEIVSSLKEGIELRMTGLVDEELAKTQFHLNLDDVEEYTIEKGMINTGLETLAVVRAKGGKVDSVKASLEKVIADKKAEAFYPGEAEVVEGTKVQVVGNYVALLIISDYEEGLNNSKKAVDIFNEALK